MSDNPVRYSPETLGALIFSIRGLRVILDADLAHIYGVPTKRLNEQVRRNADRFPPDFLIQLTPSEAKELQGLRSQFATLKRGKHIKYLPHAFTEHGAVMAADVLNSQEAIRCSLFPLAPGGRGGVRGVRDRRRRPEAREAAARYGKGLKKK
jgi:hypothetical protein